MTYLTAITVLVAAASLGGCAAAPQSNAPVSSPASTPAALGVSTREHSPAIVEGDLDITNRTSLAGFENVEVVTGTLTIVGNTRLSTLDGLEHLRAVKHLVIRENLALTNVEGLSGLRHAKSITIAGNPRLRDLDGLGGLRSVDSLVVSKNGIYCTSGLAGLREARDVVITSNPRLISLQGLRGLQSADNVTIANNPRVSAQSGLLDNLNRLTGSLEIRGNAGLHEREIAAVRSRFPEPVTVASR
jgi:hypothetical protein